MIKIKSFEIQAYRSCKKAKIIFHPELTVLIGVNGSGKSNLLNAVMLLKKILLNRYNFSRHIPKSLYTNKSKMSVEIEYEGKPVYLNCEIIFDSEERNNDDIVGFSLKWNLNSIIEGAEDIEFPTPYYDFNYREPFEEHYFQNVVRISNDDVHEVVNINKIDSQRLENMRRAYPHIRKLTEFFQSMTYYSASQFADPSKCPSFIELEDERPLRLKRPGGHDRFIRDLYLTWRKKDKDSDYQNYLDIIGTDGINLIDKISFNEVPMPSNSYEVLSGGNVKTIEKTRTIIAPIFHIDKNKLSPNQLSEGTIRALALIYYILTDKNKLFLLEEPEVCVHHGLLNSIVALLKAQSKIKQIIISTHSDYILDQLSPENLILVKRDYNKGTIAQTLTEVMQKDDFDALKNYLKESGNLGEYWKEGGLD